jgi:hypothetical protein
MQESGLLCLIANIGGQKLIIFLKVVKRNAEREQNQQSNGKENTRTLATKGSKLVPNLGLPSIAVKLDYPTSR